MNTKQKLLLIAGILTIMMIGGAMDLADAEATEREYCYRVAAGEHGHYNKGIDCEALKAVKQ